MYKQKSLYLEVLRVLAIFCVIFNHTGENGFFLFAERPVGEVQFWIDLFIAIFIRMAVPLFLAISGALMLGKEETISKLWKKRILRMLMVLVVYSMGYYLWNLYLHGEHFSVARFCTGLYRGNIVSHLWYLYLFIAYLIAIPFLRGIAKAMDDRLFVYIVTIAVVVRGVIPVVEYAISRGELSINGNITASWLVENIVLYPLIGYYIHNKLDVTEIKNRLGSIWAAALGLNCVACAMVYYTGKVTGEFSEGSTQMFFNGFTVVNCIAVMITAKLIAEKINAPEAVKKICYSIGACTFGIYLWHPWVMDWNIYTKIYEKFYMIGINKMLVALAACGFVMVVSYLISLALSKIPFIKKLV